MRPPSAGLAGSQTPIQHWVMRIYRAPSADPRTETGTGSSARLSEPDSSRNISTFALA
jgi:hypothetical protein